MNGNEPTSATQPAHGVHLKLFATCLFLYVFYTNFGFWSDNEQIRYALAKAIVEDRSFRVDRYQHFLGLDKAVYAGHVYCDKPPGSSLLILPQYLIARAVTANERLRAWLVICLSVCVYAAVSVPLLYDVLGRLGVRRARVLCCYAYAVGTLAFPYATVMVGAQFVAPLAIACLWMALAGTSRGRLAALGALIGLTFITHYHAILIVGWLIPLQWLALERRRRIVWAVAPAVAFLVLLLGYNWVCFGAPLATSYSHWQGGQARFHLSLPTLEQIHWATFSSWKGIFYFSPWLLLFVPGVARLWPRLRSWSAFVVVAVVCFGGFLLLNNQTDGHYWWGGDDFGARAFVPLLPVLAVAAGVGMEGLLAKAGARRLVGAGVALAVAFSVFACSLGALTSPVTYELTPERGSYYVQRHPHEPRVKLDGVRNPLIDTTFRALLNYGSNNIVTQLWPAADVRDRPTRGQWLLNMATNGLPLLVFALLWWPELRARRRPTPGALCAPAPGPPG